MAVKEELFENILSDPKHPVVLFSTVRHPLDRLVELMLSIQSVLDCSWQGYFALP